MRMTIAAMAVAFLGLPAAAGTIVNNGGFESTTGASLGVNFGSTVAGLTTGGPNWDVFQHLDGWTTVSGAGIELQTAPTIGGVNPHSGDYYVELDSNNNSSMAQAVGLGVGRYLLSFWYSPRTSNPDTNGIEFALGNLTGGKVTGPNGALATSVGTWTQITRMFHVKTAGVFNLRFSATGVNDSYGGLIDDVAIAPVPVPAAGLLLVGALGGLAAMRRRKSSAAV